ncbi:MAG: hypothetical protein IPL81_09460 [Flavobacteriales bacterium]|nr:hypothetical protein [Flavobacteriales bacterium]MBK6892020.1 hypothetical protein [Flavobacteriales bacterium]MBK7246159.1 hypothetical protein [Flavobacteriales bacterium]MBK9060075.1 hypothetical protein [Flavobacteriales bacterium]QQS71859.1 MAG: hypothetical protein IPP95_11795 [Flavobacteriales bacterium]
MAKKKSRSAEAVKARARRAAPKRVAGKERKVDTAVKRTVPKRTSKGYDADKYTGAIPGLAERMKEYLEHMRDDR